MTAPSIEDLQREFLAMQIAQLKRERDREHAAEREQETERTAAAAASASEKEQQAIADRRNARAADLSAVATGVGKLTGSSVTFPEKAVFREGTATSSALSLAAAEVARIIRNAPDASIPVGEPQPPRVVLLTASTDQFEAVHAANAFRSAITALHEESEHALQQPAPEAPGPAGPGRRVDDPEAAEAAEAEGGAEVPGSVAGAFVAAAVAVFDLMSVETTVAASSRKADELETHVAVLHELLQAAQGAPALRVLHETIGIPPQSSELAKLFEALKSQLSRLDAHLAKIVDELAAESAKGAPDSVRVAALEGAKVVSESSRQRIADFIALATKGDDRSKRTPLADALATARLVPGVEGGADHVAVVLPARITADQVALKRRLFAPRVVVTATATIDVIVLDVSTGGIVAAASKTGEAAFQVRFPMAWTKESEALRPTLDELGTVFAPRSVAVTRQHDERQQGDVPRERG